MTEDDADAAAFDVLPEEARPARLRQGRAYKDGGMAVVLQRDAPARTPCEAAWKIPIYQARVLEWIADPYGSTQLMFHVGMPNKELRDAVFRREERTIHGQRMVVAADSLSRTVYAARRMPGCKTGDVPRRKAS